RWYAAATPAIPAPQITTSAVVLLTPATLLRSAAARTASGPRLTGRRRPSRPDGILEHRRRAPGRFASDFRNTILGAFPENNATTPTTRGGRNGVEISPGAISVKLHPRFNGSPDCSPLPTVLGLSHSRIR